MSNNSSNIHEPALSAGRSTAVVGDEVGSKKKYASTKLSCGLVSGIAQAGVFNPWDRALYLSQKYDRKFLDFRNFENPMAGVTQTLFQRAISAGLYFPLEEIFKGNHHLLFTRMLTFLHFRSLTDGIRERVDSNELKYSPWVTVAAGNLAGAVNGLIMNPVSAIKYHYWGVECGKQNFYSTAINMFRKGGLSPFMVGATATISRDLVFGGIFAFLRHELLASHRRNNGITSNKKLQPSGTDYLINQVLNAPTHLLFVVGTSFLIDVVSATLATVLSSPINFVRNTHYATPPGVTPLPAYKILLKLWDDAANESTTQGKLRNLQSKLRLGWGSARVGCGMAFGAQVYSSLKGIIEG